MGTSSSRHGPADKPALLPSWALPGGSQQPTPPDAPDDDVREDSPVKDDDQSTPSSEQTPTTPKAPVQRLWQTARSSLTSASRGRTSGNGLRTAGRSYIRAKGGGRTAASTAVTGKGSVSRVGSFVADIARTGFDAALRSLDLGSFVGRSAEETFAAIVDMLAPEGASIEDAAARAAVSEALGLLYDKVVAGGGDLAALDTLAADDVRSAVESCITTYIYERWVGELGLSIERGAVSEARAVDLEQQMRAYIAESGKLELLNANILDVSWSKRDGKTLIDKVFQDAYSFIENKQ
jgi:hypothetical protein